MTPDSTLAPHPVAPANQGSEIFVEASAGNEPLRRLRIGFISEKNPEYRRHWSGLIHSMYCALQEHVGDVEILSLDLPIYLRALWYFVSYYRKFFFERLGIIQSIPLSIAYGRYFEKILRKRECDVLFAPIAAMEIAYLKTSLPIIYLSDTTFRAQEGYYYSRSEISSLTRWEGHVLLQKALRNAQAAVFSSDWAAGTARSLYGLRPEKIHVIPFGANIEQVPARTELTKGSTDDKCRLLTVTVDWVRKGGKLAYETFLFLRVAGIDVQYTVVGCVPGPEFSHPDFHVVPFLNKEDPAERKQLDQLYLDADFYLMPTRAECFGIVYCEAAAFGLPVIATTTGGVSTVVQQGVNGFLLPLEAGPAEYANLIARLWNDKPTYEALRESSRTRYEQTLNWNTWGTQMGKVIRAELEKSASGAQSSSEGLSNVERESTPQSVTYSSASTASPNAFVPAEPPTSRVSVFPSE